MSTHECATDRIRAEQSPHRSIMVAVNGGESGWSALDWAAAEASAHHSDLRIVHSISWPRWGLDSVGELVLDSCDTNAPERGALILEEASSRARAKAPHATITTHLEVGEPAAAILRAARGEALIVVGRRRSRWPGGRTVARTVVRLAQGPIAIIRTPITSNHKGDG